MDARRKFSNTQIKIVVVGESFVGKTSILHYLIQNQPLDQPVSTTSIYLNVKQIRINGRNYDINIWDTAGEEQYHSLTSVYLRNSMGVLIVFDVTNRTSLNAVKYWLDFITTNISEHPSIIIAANKCDLDVETRIPKDEIKDICRKYNLQYFETSAISGLNIKECFMNLVTNIVSKLDETETNYLSQLKEKSIERACC